MKAKITRRLLDAPGTKDAGEVWDAGDGACPGFYARYRGGAGSRWRYVLKYRNGAHVRHHALAEDAGAIAPDMCERLNLAPGAVWTPEAARKEAERIRGLVRGGLDAALTPCRALGLRVCR